MELLVVVASFALVFFAVKGGRLFYGVVPTIPGFYLVAALLPVFSVIPSIEGSDFSARVGYYDYLFAIIFHFFFFVCGVFGIYALTGFNTAERGAFFVGGSERFFPYKYEKKVIRAGVFLSIGIFLHQTLSLREIPFFAIFSGAYDAAEIATLREETFKLNESFALYFWHLNRQVLGPLLVAVFLYLHVRSPSRWSGLRFAGILAFVVINNAASSALAPVASIFLLLLLVYLAITPRRNIGAVIVAVVLLFAFPVFVEGFFSDKTGGQLIEAVVLKIVNRFSLETFDRTLSYFDLFPYEHPYANGATNRIFAFLSGNDVFNVQNYVFLARLTELKEHLLTGNANAHFIGYMNADFGLVGVAASSVVVGAIVGYFDVKLTRQLPRPFALACYFLCVILFWKLMGTQPTTILVSHGAILVLLFSLYMDRRARARNRIAPLVRHEH